MDECAAEPIRKKRYIEESTAHNLIRMVVPSAQLPFCCHAAATHAAGSSVAALAARAMRANLSFFREQVNICLMELGWEQDYSPAKLKEHLDILQSLDFLLSSLTADRDPDAGDSPTDEHTETKNLMAQVFARLPQDDLRCYNECVIRLRYMLQNGILLKMETSYRGMESDRQSDWENTVRDLLDREVAPVLERMYRELTGLLAGPMSAVVSKTRGDFEDDVIQIGVDGHTQKKGMDKSLSES